MTPFGLPRNDLARADTPEAEIERLALIVDQLQEALETRDVIGQAKGRIMQHHDVSAEEAWEILRKESQHQNIRLATLAALIADGTEPLP